MTGKMIWITEGRAFEVVTCSAWRIEGMCLIRPMDAPLNCIMLGALGVHRAPCVACEMYREGVEDVAVDLLMTSAFRARLPPIGKA